MKKIGFIDYYLDEWHANNYPKFIHDISNGEMEAVLAYGKKDAENGLTNEQWSNKYGVKFTPNMEELIDKCDYLLVLSPDNPEMHEELCQLPLRSGKRTFVDKTFAPSKEIAERIFELADKYKTPMYSSSALRFSNEFAGIDKQNVDFISSRGPGATSNYLIHQVEPIVSIMGAQVKRIMFTGSSRVPGFLIEYSDGRRATLSQFGWDIPFSMTLGYDANKTVVINECTDYFNNFIKNMLNFFKTGKDMVPASETISIMAILEKANMAAQRSGEWVDLK